MGEQRVRCVRCSRGEPPEIIEGRAIHRGRGDEKTKPCSDPPAAHEPRRDVPRGVKFVAKLQRSLYRSQGAPEAILFYDEARTFQHVETDPEVVTTLKDAMGPAVKVYAWCSIDHDGRLHVHEPAQAPDPEW